MECKWIGRLLKVLKYAFELITNCIQFNCDACIFIGVMPIRIRTLNLTGNKVREHEIHRYLSIVCCFLSIHSMSPRFRVGMRTTYWAGRRPNCVPAPKGLPETRISTSANYSQCPFYYSKSHKNIRIPDTHIWIKEVRNRISRENKNETQKIEGNFTANKL